MISKENKFGHTFTYDKWEYCFIDHKDADLDDSDDLFDEIKEALKEMEQSDLKELLRVIPPTKKKSIPHKSEWAIKLRTYLGSDTEVICPEFIEGYPVIRLSSSTFSKCKDTTVKLFIPSSIQKIPEGIFKNCPVLETIEILGANDYYEVLDGCLYDKRNGTILFCDRTRDEVTIQRNVKQLGTYALGDSNSLRKITISSNDITIPIDLFKGCKRLKTLRLPASFEAFDYKSGVFFPAPAYYVDLTECDNLGNIFYDGTWKQWLQMPVRVRGAVAIHVQDGSVHNDQREDDFLRELTAELDRCLKKSGLLQSNQSANLPVKEVLQATEENAT